MILLQLIYILFYCRKFDMFKFGEFYDDATLFFHTYFPYC